MGLILEMGLLLEKSYIRTYTVNKAVMLSLSIIGFSKCLSSSIFFLLFNLFFKSRKFCRSLIPLFHSFKETVFNNSKVPFLLILIDPISLY